MKVLIWVAVFSLIVLGFLGCKSLTAERNSAPVLLNALNSPFRPIAFRLYLFLGDNINEKNLQGQTALMEASSLCSLKYVRILLASGADPNIKNMNGETAIMLIGSNGSDDAYLIAYELIQAGANLSEVSIYEMTALRNAKKLDNKKLIKLIEDSLKKYPPH